jgi:hypothetical protein
VNMAVSFSVNQVANTIQREKSTGANEHEDEQQREKQRDVDEAMLDAAVEAALQAQEEASEMKFQALLANKRSSYVMRGVASVVSSLDPPTDVERSNMSTKSESKFKPTARGLLEMPLFSDAIHPDTKGWKLDGPTTYHIQKAPLYEEIFDDSKDHVDHEVSAKEIERQLQGRTVAISRQRKLLRSNAANIALKAITPKHVLKALTSKLGSLAALSSVIKREEELERASFQLDKRAKAAGDSSMKLTTLPDQDMSVFPQPSPLNDVGQDFKRLVTPSLVDMEDGIQLKAERPGSRARSKLNSRAGSDNALVGSPALVETVLEEDEDEV